MEVKPKAITARGTPVYCAFDELVDIEAVIPNPRNPNQHPERQIKLLAKIIQHQGWRAPITVSRRSGFVVRGHGRLMAARLLGETNVPVDYQNYATEAEEWADLIADNRIAELSQMDNEFLKDLLQEIDTGEIDMELSGFEEAELERMLTAVPPDVEFPEYDEEIENEVKKVVCPECGHEFFPFQTETRCRTG